MTNDVAAPDPEAATPLLSIRCTMLWSEAFMRPGTEHLVRHVGNWVGGRLRCLDDRLVFRLNWTDAFFSAYTSDVTVPYDMIERVSYGRMLRFFRTVEIDIGLGVIPIRAIGRSNVRLHEFLHERIVPHGPMIEADRGRLEQRPRLTNL